MPTAMRSGLSLALFCLTSLACSGSDDPSGLGGDPLGGTGSGRPPGSGGRGSGVVLGGGPSSGGRDAGQGGGSSACKPNLTGLVRDFKAKSEPGGHPDFETFSGQSASKGIVRAELGNDQKPVYNGTGAIRNDQNGQQTTSKERFDEWYRNTEGVNQAVELTLELKPGQNGVSTYENREFFPIDGEGFGNYEPYQNGLHNYHFTFELHTTFAYNGKEVFRFIGDDDLWVFINGKLAIDLGGLHSELNAEVSLDQIAEQFGLVKGQTYALDLFHAERHTSHSRFRIDTSIEFTNCNPIIIPR